jgi:allantoicase
VHGVIVDTAFFKGNYPPEVSVEASGVEGAPSPDELARAEWTTLVPRSPVGGDRDNPFTVDDDRRWTHVRLTIYPDGGVARFRVHGEPVPDPRLLTGTVDLAALEHGGDVVDCSDSFYSSPLQLLLPGRARIMGDGWENARRRDGGNDHVTVRLAAPGLVRRVEIDTSCFVGNAPGEAALTGTAEDGTPVTLVPRTRLQPDTRHHFRVRSDAPVTHVRLDVFPDGGLARLRVHGEIPPATLAETTVRWLDRLPEQQAREVLAEAGLSADEAGKLLAARPFTTADAVPAEVVTALLGG